MYVPTYAVTVADGLTDASRIAPLPMRTGGSEARRKQSSLQHTAARHGSQAPAYRFPIDCIKSSPSSFAHLPVTYCRPPPLCHARRRDTGFVASAYLLGHPLTSPLRCPAKSLLSERSTLSSTQQQLFITLQMNQACPTPTTAEKKTPTPRSIC
ncbi:unnamed protein product [Periconia digitata]|uniref:Uncharacterized protein n=1 Tax=Periconia digitata TaxID=1303443 RepID=A0A9W4U0Z7_9PLEO|nr:unnamed protein product [Periconia digitata]